MKTCHKCGTDVKTSKCIKEGITLECLKCPKCGKEYLTSSELARFDIKRDSSKRKITDEQLPIARKKAFGSLKLKKPTQEVMDEIDEGYD